MNGKYNLVDTVEKLKQLDQILMDPNGKPRYNLVAYDTETNGLQLYKSTVIGFSISISQTQGWYIPFLVWERDPKSKKPRTYKKKKYPEHWRDGWLRCIWTGEKFPEFVTPQEYKIAERMPLIPALLSRWLLNVNLDMWNAPFDVNMTYICTGVDLKNNLFLDGSLLVHALDENFSVALKPNAEKYKEALGINPHVHAAMEKKELVESIIINGGTPGQVWRADLEPQMKYACADTMFTYGINRAATKQFADEYGQKGLEWFFNQEVMPVCREVVIDMKRRGVYIDVAYFQKLFDENQIKMNELEDSIIEELEKLDILKDFNVGQSIDEAVSNQRLIKEIIVMEGREVPTKANKEGIIKETIAKGEVKKIYNQDPHWIWGYILGEDEIKYSDQQVMAIKKKLYLEIVDRRHRFNIGSGDHLRWLFCDTLGLDKKSLPQTDSATKENPIPKMGAEVLEQHMLPKWPWVSKLMSWKKLQKLQSTYIKPALVLNIDGWLYMDMKQNGTISGRFSCSGGYNLQTLPRVDDELEILEACEKCHAETYDKEDNLTGNITITEELTCMSDMICNKCGHTKYDIPRPSAIKAGFVAPPGYKIVNADYSSLEPRCFAVMSGEDAIKQVYWDGLDLYSQVYCQIFDTNHEYSANPKDPNFLKKVAKPKRTWVKPIVLGIPYGAEEAQVAGLVNAKKKIPDKENPGQFIELPDFEEGKRILDLYFKAFPNLKKYMDEQDFKAITMGYVETIVGRRRHLPFIKVVTDVLNKYGIDVKDLKYAPKRSIQKANCSYVSKRGVKVTLTEDMLTEIKEQLGIRSDTLATKGYWSLIRSMIKNDLNGAKNTPIQGLAGHITNKGMLDTNRYYKQNNVDAWVCLQVHDEITAYAKIEEAETGAKYLKLGMEENEFTKLLDVAMIADPIVCDTLKEAK